MLKEALEKVLACPSCYERLILSDSEEQLSCTNCVRKYPVIKGIPDFIIEVKQNNTQQSKRAFRTKVASLHENRSVNEVLSEVKRQIQVRVSSSL
jgi:uncharacterized protein YbaR (Trm112 family)